MSIKVAALSDMHGNLDVRVPPCDVCLIAGDVCPWRYGDTTLDQANWLREEFAAWARRQPAGKFVVTWGNHDWIGQKSPDLVPTIPGVKFLCDQEYDLVYTWRNREDERYRFWGTPWQPPFYDWAFNLPEPELQKRWWLISEHTDVLVCHGPPRGYGDLVERRDDGRPLQEHELVTFEGLRVGSPSLLKRILEVKPQLVVFGHIHEGFGHWQLDHGSGKVTTLANVSVVDSRYRLVREPMTFTVKG